MEHAVAGRVWLFRQGQANQHDHTPVSSKHAIAVRPWPQLQVAAHQLPVPVTKAAGYKLCIMSEGYDMCIKGA